MGSFIVSWKIYGRCYKVAWNETRYFRLSKGKNNSKRVYPCLVDVEPCTSYWNKGMKEKCPVCPNVWKKNVENSIFVNEWS